MNEEIPSQLPFSDGQEQPTGVRSLQDLLDRVTGKTVLDADAGGDSGLVDIIPFPFLALVGQREMKIALLLALINPGIGGVLLIGPRGTGKTTAVRSLVDLLPQVPRSLCFYGCMPEDIELGGLEAVCPDCARKFAEGQSLTRNDPVRLIELPLNARLDDVVGKLDERAAGLDHRRIQRGILAQADRNLLYVDEVNLLEDNVVDAILDAAAHGSYSVRRGPVSAAYRSRFVLIGSMNPEEGNLRPQILDRFGLRLVVRGLEDQEARLEAYRRAQTYQQSPRRLANWYKDETWQAKEEIQKARETLTKVILPEEVAQKGLALIKSFKIDSLRAELTLFEAARAHAAADGREEVSLSDLETVAPMALRLRRSEFIATYFSNRASEEKEIDTAIETHLT